jgi:hypothetical protein
VALGVVVTLHRFAHVRAMSDAVGMFEHADHDRARPEHGYCTDDMARLLIVAVREPGVDAPMRDLRRTTFRFLVAAQGPSGLIRNRRTTGGRWLDRHGVEDCWGRSVWAFGTAARFASDDWLRSSAVACFDRSVEQRSPHRRAMAFAALGAADVVARHPGHRSALDLLADTVDVIGPVVGDPMWPWPEPRLTYANAAVAEALIAAGDALERADVVADGLLLLGWLLDRETVDEHLSPTPVGGAGIENGPCRFDQQPLEAAAMADACARALALTGDERWRRGLGLAVAWFRGANDGGAVMWDAGTAGGYDGLTIDGVNLNQGAESTLALISTMQHASNTGITVPAATVG